MSIDRGEWKRGTPLLELYINQGKRDRAIGISNKVKGVIRKQVESLRDDVARFEARLKRMEAERGT